LERVGTTHPIRFKIDNLRIQAGHNRTSFAHGKDVSASQNKAAGQHGT